MASMYLLRRGQVAVYTDGSYAEGAKYVTFGVHIQEPTNAAFLFGRLEKLDHKLPTPYTAERAALEAATWLMKQLGIVKADVFNDSADVVDDVRAVKPYFKHMYGRFPDLPTSVSTVYSGANGLADFMARLPSRAMNEFVNNVTVLQKDEIPRNETAQCYTHSEIHHSVQLCYYFSPNLEGILSHPLFEDYSRRMNLLILFGRHIVDAHYYHWVRHELQFLDVPKKRRQNRSVPI